MRYILVAFLILISDRISKWIVMQQMVEGQSIPLIPPVLYLTYVRNTGAAFGLFRGRALFLSVLAVIGVVFVLTRWNHIAAKSSIVKWGVTIALGGALGNLIDRLRWGAVVDFVDLPLWPIFNVADLAIVGGVALLFWEVLFSEGS
ncbi:MAG: signal peptidase II [Firmicutes bacterium]|nr:signal peptidase II [Bacillota bacterium]